ncbi:hypothetical protein QFC24_006310 [Naganishia onofrii]|uniref:Uncharacterized protein n=1 Tax=Naganishia onofrii TaxID=1851511 RepID=A0ACC2X2W5_9TREE|nr:hypothetical protein QFC24_006310 [Naganishia onofrii]
MAFVLHRDKNASDPFGFYKEYYDSLLEIASDSQGVLSDLRSIRDALRERSQDTAGIEAVVTGWIDAIDVPVHSCAIATHVRVATTGISAVCDEDLAALWGVQTTGAAIYGERWAGCADTKQETCTLLPSIKQAFKDAKRELAGWEARLCIDVPQSMQAFGSTNKGPGKLAECYWKAMRAWKASHPRLQDTQVHGSGQASIVSEAAETKSLPMNSAPLSAHQESLKDFVKGLAQSGMLAGLVGCQLSAEIKVLPADTREASSGGSRKISIVSEITSPGKALSEIRSILKRAAEHYRNNLWTLTLTAVDNTLDDGQSFAGPPETASSQN